MFRKTTHALFALTVTLAFAAAQDAPVPIPILQARTTPIANVDRSPDCYHQFREGGCVVTRDGTLVVVAQGREKSRWSDRSGQDLVCRTSRDHGSTWSTATLVVAHGDHSVCPNATVYDANPAEVAARFARHGIRRLHTVDLDGAKAGHPVNGAAIRGIVAAVGDVPVQLGGGIRTLDAVEEVLASGESSYKFT